MKAKLSKRPDGLYFLNNEFGNLMYVKLSLKNCQAIEKGYDLDELAIKNYPNNNFYSQTSIEQEERQKAFVKGCETMIELMSDKKYSEDDVIDIAEYVRVASQSSPSVRTKYLLADYQSQQQTEWEVEVEMEKVKDETKIIGSVKGIKGSGHKITTYKSVPKLDADGCLILKKI